MILLVVNCVGARAGRYSVLMNLSIVLVDRMPVDHPPMIREPDQIGARVYAREAPSAGR